MFRLALEFSSKFVLLLDDSRASNRRSHDLANCWYNASSCFERDGSSHCGITDAVHGHLAVLALYELRLQVAGVCTPRELTGSGCSASTRLQSRAATSRSHSSLAIPQSPVYASRFTGSAAYARRRRRSKCPVGELPPTESYGRRRIHRLVLRGPEVRKFAGPSCGATVSGAGRVASRHRDRADRLEDSLRALRPGLVRLPQGLAVLKYVEEV